MKLKKSAAFTTSIVAALLLSTHICRSQETLLPLPDTSLKLQQLKQFSTDDIRKELQAPRDLVPNVRNLGDAGTAKLEANDNKASVPFVVPNSVVIQFTPETTPAEVEAYLKDKNLRVIKTFPTIGAVQVETDLSPYFAPALSDNGPNDAVIRGITTTIQEFKKDTRVQSVSPDVFLSDKSNHDAISIENMLHPSDVTTAVQDEAMDWGITDIEADKLWSLPGASDGAILGIMDVGFARHDDLTFLEFPRDAAPDNHGNHVAGICCGRHNGKGIKGVLPNCHVRAKSGDVFFMSAEGTQITSFFVLFSQILGTLNTFIDSHDDVSTFNVSLGYNWRSNFGIDIDAPESAIWRVLVENQGAILVSVLEAANRKGKVIFSAAGNDSEGLATPTKAKYASPFNWAAITSREAGRSANGVIVAAHDRNGRRANFSNAGADISCPGVNIQSTIAFDAGQNLSMSSYGKMSGTSMASPYCAAGHMLFRLVRPGYSGVEIVDCFKGSGPATDEGVPMLRLNKALQACPARG